MLIDSNDCLCILKVTASDEDSAAYGEITFSLVTSSVPFTIEPSTGELLVNGNLDRETTDSYDLTIQAKDGMLVWFVRCFVAYLQ